MTTLIRALVLVPLLLATGHAPAALKSFQVVGKVIQASGALAPYDVQAGSAVQVSWTVELATPPFAAQGPPDNRTDYCGPVKFFLIRVGNWSAISVAPPPTALCTNTISVADGSGGVLDLLHVATRGTDNDLVLHRRGFLNLSVDLYDIAGDAGTGQGLDQDPSRYRFGAGSAVGPGGALHFEIEGSGSHGGIAGDSTARCRKAQLTAAATLCKQQLRCHAAHARRPARDPLLAKRDACLDRADGRFARASARTASRALSTGRDCPTSAPASEQLVPLGEAIDAIAASASAIEPRDPRLEAAWLNAAAAACAASVGAHAAHAGRANVGRLVKRLTRTSAKLEAAAEKAAASAARRGVAFATPPDVPAFQDGVDAAVEIAVSRINGD